MNANLFEANVPPPVIELRPYQSQSLAHIHAAIDRGAGRGLLVLPTGTGKTTVFSELIRERRATRASFKCLVIAHQLELLEQARARIQAMNPSAIVSIESGDQSHDPQSHVIVAGVQTIGRRGTNRLKSWRPDLIIIDEAHHACADSYQIALESVDAYDEHFGPYTLGVTATDHRLDNKPLHGHEHAIFQEVLYRYTLRQAVEDGWLCDVAGYRVGTDALDLSKVRKSEGDYAAGELQTVMDVPAITACAWNAWEQVAKGLQTVIFCTGVDHAAHVADYWNSQGITAASLSGKTPPDERARVMEAFRAGEIQVIANMQLLTEGVDVPNIACVLILRPTQSWALLTQMVGRGLRLAPGKDKCIVIEVLGTKKERDERAPATLAGAFGLPAGLSLGGKTIKDAFEAIDPLSDEQKAVLGLRYVDLDNVTATLEEIDLLAELAKPESLLGISDMAWLKYSDDLYALGCGTDEKGKRQATLTCDGLGTWSLLLKDGSGTTATRLGDDLRLAFQTADFMVEQQFPGIRALAAANAKWRTDPATTAQKVLLIKEGYTEAQVEAMDKGQASDLITKAFAKKPKRQERYRK